MQSNPFTDIDAQWAWSPWQATDQLPWNEQTAAHLMRRAGFGCNSSQLKELANGSLTTALDGLFSNELDDMAFKSASRQLSQSALVSDDAKGLATWWLRDMLETQSPLREKMTLFWHGHFATGADKVREPQVMLNQNQLLRDEALGSFARLAHGIAKDPAMLIYLDSAVNRKAHPNENFARELMELFCLGEGNYSEHDVQELARCFTGWEVRRNQFRFNALQHDSANKSLLGVSQVESGEQAVDAVLSCPQAALFVVGKLFRLFIADEPASPAGLLKPVADQLIADQWNLARPLRTMLSSQLFFSPQVRARKIRSPIDWALNWMKACELSTNIKKLSDALAELGQSVFYPPNVKGWDGGRAWINSSTLVGRTNLISQLVRDPATRWAGGTIESFWRRERVDNVDQFVAWLETNLLALPLSASSRQRLSDALQAAGGFERSADCLLLAATLPEMHLA